MQPECSLHSPALRKPKGCSGNVSPESICRTTIRGICVFVPIGQGFRLSNAHTLILLTTNLIMMLAHAHVSLHTMKG